jgi:hypothetical protein
VNRVAKNAQLPRRSSLSGVRPTWRENADGWVGHNPIVSVDRTGRRQPDRLEVQQGPVCRPPDRCLLCDHQRASADPIVGVSKRIRAERRDFRKQRHLPDHRPRSNPRQLSRRPLSRFRRRPRHLPLSPTPREPPMTLLATLSLLLLRAGCIPTGSKRASGGNTVKRCSKAKTERTPPKRCGASKIAIG